MVRTQQCTGSSPRLVHQSEKNFYLFLYWRQVTALVFIIVYLTEFAQELSSVLGHPAAKHTVEDIVDARSTLSVGTGDPSSQEGGTVSLHKGCAATGTTSSLARRKQEQYSAALVKEHQLILSKQRKGIEKAV